MLQLRRKSELLSRWGHGDLADCPGRSCKQNYGAHGRPQQNRSDTGVAHTDPSWSLKHTATLNASSSSFKPHEAMGTANSQSLLCCVDAARKEARWCAELRELRVASTSASSSSTAGRSQKNCLMGKVSGTSSNFADQTNIYSINSPSDFPQSPSKSTWSDSVLAAEAIKVEIASKATHLTPRPPSLTGKLAWIHWLSVKLELVMRWIDRASQKCIKFLKWSVHTKRNFLLLTFQVRAGVTQNCARPSVLRIVTLPLDECKTIRSLPVHPDIT